MDKFTKQRIENLHPFVMKEITEIIEACNEALTGKTKIRITQGLRTIEE